MIVLTISSEYKNKMFHLIHFYYLDPVTKEYLKKNIDPVFGFPSIVRFSWSTAELVLKNNAAQVDWYVDAITSWYCKVFFIFIF